VNFAKLNERFISRITAMTSEHKLAAAVSPADVAAIMQGLIRKATAGDVAAAKFVLDRVEPEPTIWDAEIAAMLSPEKKSDVA
jgi:hypothetical protein